MERSLQSTARCTFLLVIMAIAGCASFGADPHKRLLGEWHSSIGGYPVDVTYTTATVQVDGAKPVAYTLEGTRLRFAHGGSQVRIVTFPSRNEMIQTDPLTGAAQHYVRAGAPVRGGE